MTAQELFTDEIATPIGVKDVAPRAKIKVIGVGGGGGNAVNYMHRIGIIGVEFAICNTDAQVLEKSNVPVKIRIGQGLGAGMIADTARQIAEDSIEDLKLLFVDKPEMVFITTGLGGGTGTGVAPVIARLAKEANALTVAIVTRPFDDEGILRLNQAAKGIEDLQAVCDTVLVIANDKLKDEYYDDLTQEEAFAKVDDVLANAAKSIAEVITNPGIINIDFNDVNTVLKDVKGPSVMGSAIGEGENRASEAIMKALDSPLLENHDISGANNILLSIAYSTQNKMKMKEQKAITSYISQRIKRKTNRLKLGTMYDESLKDDMRITVIASDFRSSQQGDIVTEPEDISILRPIIEPVPDPTNPNLSQPTPIPVIDNYDSWQAAMKEAQDWPAYFRKYKPADSELEDPTYKRKNLQKFFIEESTIPAHLKVIEDLLA